MIGVGEHGFSQATPGFRDRANFRTLAVLQNKIPCTPVGGFKRPNHLAINFKANLGLLPWQEATGERN